MQVQGCGFISALYAYLYWRRKCSEHHQRYRSPPVYSGRHVSQPTVSVRAVVRQLLSTRSFWPVPPLLSRASPLSRVLHVHGTHACVIGSVYFPTLVRRRGSSSAEINSVPVGDGASGVIVFELGWTASAVANGWFGDWTVWAATRPRCKPRSHNKDADDAAKLNSSCGTPD